ncbi:hypothetical protein [Candidatus Palauibacter sp.]|uniref:hypothetical protein n=1 Tax=Candidatus Palauibacter sp. TaxID=3101350 RepID=UPI003B019643
MATGGGVVLNGRSNCNFPSDECVGEGNSGPYGGTITDDDSGQLSYVRIEYGGLEVSFGNELNGLTLNGVGSGTQLDHIQSHYGSDDGIELFGGTVDLKYAYVTGASDDSFDYSTGWQGRGQFWAAQQDPHDADNGFEVDGNEENFDAEPFTDPDIYNVTLVGDESDAPIDEEALWSTDGWGNVAGVDPLLVNPFNLGMPDFRPAAGSPLTDGYAEPPAGGDFFEAVDYIGAFAPGMPQWIEGWTTQDQG